MRTGHGIGRSSGQRTHTTSALRATDARASQWPASGVQPIDHPQELERAEWLHQEQVRPGLLGAASGRVLGRVEAVNITMVAVDDRTRSARQASIPSSLGMSMSKNTRRGSSRPATSSASCPFAAGRGALPVGGPCGEPGGGEELEQSGARGSPRRWPTRRASSRGGPRRSRRGASPGPGRVGQARAGRRGRNPKPRCNQTRRWSTFLSSRPGVASGPGLRTPSEGKGEVRPRCDRCRRSMARAPAGR